MMKWLMRKLKWENLFEASPPLAEKRNFGSSVGLDTSVSPLPATFLEVSMRKEQLPLNKSREDLSVPLLGSIHSKKPIRKINPPGES